MLFVFYIIFFVDFSIKSRLEQFQLSNHNYTCIGEDITGSECFKWKKIL